MANLQQPLPVEVPLMATLLRIIAQQCIVGSDWMTLAQFEPPAAAETDSYCSAHLVHVALIEAITRLPDVLARCISEAVHDPDLELAFEYFDQLFESNPSNAITKVRRHFMAALAHEIKAALQEQQDLTRAPAARS